MAASASADCIEGQKLTSSLGSEVDQYGVAVAVDGDTAVIGSLAAGGGMSAAYVYVQADGSWTQQQILSAPDAFSSNFYGEAVAVSGDIAVVGCRGDDQAGGNRGAAYVFVRLGGIWTLQQKLLSSASSGGSFGNSVAVSGETIVVGSRHSAVYVFVRSGGVWTEQQKLTVPGTNGSEFGMDADISVDNIIVGAANSDLAGNDAGVAYAFVRYLGLWYQIDELLASDASSGQRFGYSVALENDTAVIGAPTGGVGTNAAYVFIRDGLDWYQQQKLTASDAGGGDRFGDSVDVSGDRVIVGAYQNNAPAQDSGTAYVYMRENGVWTQEARLVPADWAWEDNFGKSVGVSGRTFVIGAHQDDSTTGGGDGYAVIFHCAPPNTVRHADCLSAVRAAAGVSMCSGSR